MANKSMLLGSGNSTMNITNTNIKFGAGEFDESKVISIATAENADSKVRFVYNGPGDSGLIFVGNELVSSKILDIVPVISASKVFDEKTGTLVESTTEKSISQILVKWFGTLVDPTDNVSKTKVWTDTLDIIDRDSVAEMIKASEYAVNTKFEKVISDASALHKIINSSIYKITSYLKNKIVTALSQKAIDISTGTSSAGFTTYKVGVNVDNSTVKIVNNKLAVDTYSIDKLNEGEDGYSTEWSALYRLLKTDAKTGKVTQCGELINIMKDMLVKDVHVCTFKYVSNDGTLIDYDKSDKQWSGSSTKVQKGDDVIAGQLPWAKLVDGSWEEAIIGKGIKYGNTYLHLILNTRPTDETTEGDGNLKTTDVYLDFSQIFSTFKGDGEYINVTENGVITLDIDNVIDTVDSSLGITTFIENTSTKLASVDSSLNSLDSSVNELADKLKNFSGNYVQQAILNAPKEENSQFNELVIQLVADGSTKNISVDIANASFYEALNTALTTLQSNDEYLAGLLTWEEL